MAFAYGMAKEIKKSFAFLKMKRDRSQDFIIVMRTPAEAAQLLSSLQFALMPLNLLQERVRTVTRTLTPVGAEATKRKRNATSVEMDEGQKILADELDSLATKTANVITNIGTVSKALVDLAHGAEMTDAFTKVMSAVELVGPIFLAISLISRGVGMLAKASIYRAELPDLHKRLKHAGRECVGILCRALNDGSVDEPLLCDMYSTVTACWSVSQAVERLMMSSFSRLIWKGSAVEAIAHSMKEIEDQLRSMHVIDYVQRLKMEHEKRDAAQDTEINQIKNKLRDQTLLQKSKAAQEKADKRIHRVHYVPYASRITAKFAPDPSDEPETNEEKLKRLILDIPGSVADSVGAAGAMYCAQGMGGVGKTCALISVGNNADVKSHFSGGIFYALLGKDANEKDVVEKFAQIARVSGGRSCSRKILGASSMDEAAEYLKQWLLDDRVLYMFDDMWNASFLSALGMLPTGSSKMILSTRDLSIAQMADTVVRFSVHEPLGEVSRRIFLKHAGTSEENILEANCGKELEGVLGVCRGLPIALAIAGNAIRKKIGSRKSIASSLRKYASTVSERLEKLTSSEFRAYEYLSLEAAIYSSVEQLAEEQNISFTALRGTDGRDLSDLFEEVAVVKNQAWMPPKMLQCLWMCQSEDEAEEIAELFVNHSLLSESTREVVSLEIDDETREADGYMIHDLVLDICRRRAKKSGRLQQLHSRFLDKYCDLVLLQESVQPDNVPQLPFCRPWWSNCLSPDGYIHQNLATHLVAAGCAAELLQLLLDARWSRRQLMCGGTLTLQSDYDTVINAINQKKCAAIHGLSINDMIEQLTTISKALLGASGRLIKHPETFAFEVIGRLTNAREDMVLVEKFLKSVERTEDKPWLRPWRQIYPDPREGLSQEILAGGSCWSVAYFPCGTLLAAAGTSNLLIIDLKSGRISNRLEGHEGYVRSVSVCQRGTRVVSGSEDHTVRMWDARTGLQIGSPLGGHEDIVTCVEITPDGKYVVSGSWDKTVRIWSIAQHAQDGFALTGHEASVQCVAVSPGGRFVLSGSSDKTIRRWNLRTRAQVSDPLVQLVGVVSSIAISPDGSSFVSGCWSGEMRMFSADTGAPVGGVTGANTQKAPVFGLAFMPDGQHIIQRKEWQAQEL